MRGLGWLICGVMSFTLLLISRADAEPRGTWRFTDETRPVKAVVVGGSVTAYPAGGFPQWLPSVCPAVEVQNLGMARLGAAALRERFQAQVVKNPRLGLKIGVAPAAETWLIFLGGLNSVGTPEVTNIEVAKTLAAAHAVGLHTMALTLNPWGAERDRRWKGIEGIKYFEHTQKTVDFVMGRLTPTDAFGEKRVAATVADVSRFDEGQLPDKAVDVWSHGLRDEAAALRPLEPLRREAKRSAWVRAQVADLPESEREAAVERLVMQAAALPRWFMRPELIGFDAIHPNAEGHGMIMRAICAQAPPSWQCDCAALATLTWDRRAARPVPR